MVIRVWGMCLMFMQIMSQCKTFFFFFYLLIYFVLQYDPNHSLWFWMHTLINDDILMINDDILHNFVEFSADFQICSAFWRVPVLMIFYILWCCVGDSELVWHDTVQRWRQVWEDVNMLFSRSVYPHTHSHTHGCLSWSKHHQSHTLLPHLTARCQVITSSCFSHTWRSSNSRNMRCSHLWGMRVRAFMGFIFMSSWVPVNLRPLLVTLINQKFGWYGHHNS